ncbi:hypothetical protein [Actinoplanes auranticolor]|uniref:Uncharacterized protein n=1 Tax=Actinoplanes auranticolor TaxID=47988 RepID=A0A919S7F3_9ACTN|nr:hypothetical protein [Actinoplanes auranticolor]GIM65500.1 hypothetical protein Aau02nite_17580 [Actinoplanes auranticolor]
MLIWRAWTSPKNLAEVVVDIVIDRVWSALGGSCPSVEQHPEVYKYTARPLMGEALGLVSDGIKAQTIALFTAWWGRRSPEALA